MQYLWFPCERAIRRLWVCTSRPLTPKASRSALRRCPGGPGGFLDWSDRPRVIKAGYSIYDIVAMVLIVLNKKHDLGVSGRIIDHHSLMEEKLRFGLRPVRIA